MITLQLRSDVKLHDNEGDLLLHYRAASSFERTLTLHRPSLVLRAIVKMLAEQPAEERVLEDKCLSEEQLLELYFLLDNLKKYALLTYSLYHQEVPQLTLISHAPNNSLGNSLECQGIEEEKPLQLSRFCYLRAEGVKFIVETPLSACRLTIHSADFLSILHRLVVPHSLKELAQVFPEMPIDSLRVSLRLLLDSQIVTASEEDAKLTQWEFHDLLFHARSRTGRHINPFGVVYPYIDKIPPLPVCKPPLSREPLPLYQPDLDKLIRDDASFSWVVENRKSIREHGENAITFEQLGEFLYRVARIRDTISLKENGEISNRPYPCGGALYELELYMVIHRCEGIEEGLYHYNPQFHNLHPLEVSPVKMRTLLEDASNSAAIASIPQVLIIISARFQRVSWKYRSMAYATILKNTGVLLQTMYLVATAMKLAPCALGRGNADLFAEMIDAYYFEESSVGEFMLGSQP